MYIFQFVRGEYDTNNIKRKMNYIQMNFKKGNSKDNYTYKPNSVVKMER